MTNDDSDRGRETAPPAGNALKPKAGLPDETSPLLTLNSLQSRLDVLLQNSEHDMSFPQGIREITLTLQELCLHWEELCMSTIALSTVKSYCVAHSIHTAIVCESVAQYLGWPDEKRQSLICAALTMNMAMRELQDRLYTRRGSLSDLEKEVIAGHPLQSVQLLKAAGVADYTWLLAVGQHHELINGTGYPQGLRGEEVADEARLLCLADVYGARISSRLYRSPLMPHFAVNAVFKDRGSKFDSAYVRVFINKFGLYPPGTLLRLTSGELAIATQRGEKLTAPLVHIIATAQGDPVSPPVFGNTAESRSAIKEVIHADNTPFFINLHGLWHSGVFGKGKKHLRRQARLRTHITAGIFDPQEKTAIEAVLLDISLSGCLLRIEKQPASFGTAPMAGTALSADYTYLMTFRALGRTLDNIPFIVKQSSEDRDYHFFGVEFLNLDESVAQTLSSMVKGLKSLGAVWVSYNG